MTKAAILAFLKEYPKRPSTYYAYGTAGFRFEIDDKYATCIFIRAGLVAYARAVFLGRAVGLCITASHNPVKDNGVKIIDPDGGMLAPSWETIAAKVANAETPEQCIEILSNICGDKLFHSKSEVILARDTRPHSKRLEDAAKEAISKIGGTPHSIGITTTPQLHFVVMTKNGMGYNKHFPPTLEGYSDCLVKSYKDLVDGTEPARKPIQIDCSNGVGALSFPGIADSLKDCGFNYSLINADVQDHERLNEKCGAEHVQKTQSPPANVSPSSNTRFASFDGDADRIVFFSIEPKFRLFDGDKIACLMAYFIKEHIKVLFPNESDVSIGTVQTAYANGSSSKFLKEVLRVDAPFVKTGVKHLHHKALDYDIGVYFEANGHGTCLFRPSFVEKLGELKDTPEKRRLLALTKILNQATGDAFSDLLAVDAILRVLKFDEEKWEALYSDLPSKQLKVKVQDRSVVETTEDETRCIRPQALQDRLDSAVKNIPSGRVFVRPSGTEDVVRVYAEAASQEDAEALANAASEAIMEEAGGIPDSKRMKV